MSIGSRLFAKLLNLPPAETHDIAVEKDIEIPMPDSVNLLADRYYPRDGENPPLIMIRTPYGRAGIFGMVNGRLIAERGFQVLVQSCRGTFGSGGEFVPFQDEQADGLATIEWLKKQAWFNGQFAMHGSSYQGFTQWAVARDAGPELKAMLTMDTGSEVRSLMFAGGAFGLEDGLNFVNILETQEGSQFALVWSQLGPNNPLKKAYHHLPLNEIDNVAFGKIVPFWQDLVTSNKEEIKWWDQSDFSETLSEVSASAFMIGGWYDVYITQTIRDYQLLKRAGQQPQLTIGPWVHADMKSVSFNFGEALAWFRAHLLGDKSGVRDMPVRIYVMGADEWRDFPDFPPENVGLQVWYLQANGRLSPNLPDHSEPDHYRYDPADPTPSVGGASLGKAKGPQDNRELEARSDVLVYTSESLAEPLEIMGTVQAQLFVQSSLGHTDFFARLCDVDPKGKSTNICDMLIRLEPGQIEPEADGSLKVEIDLSPTAYRFNIGHAVRLQVSSGAFPRWSRNTGSGEPLGSANKMLVAEQTVYHDPEHLSAVVLPVVGYRR